MQIAEVTLCRRISVLEIFVPSGGTFYTSLILSRVLGKHSLWPVVLVSSINSAILIITISCLPFHPTSVQVRLRDLVAKLDVLPGAARPSLGIVSVPRGAPGRLYPGAAVQLVGTAVPIEDRLEPGRDLGGRAAAAASARHHQVHHAQPDICVAAAVADSVGALPQLHREDCFHHVRGECASFIGVCRWNRARSFCLQTFVSLNFIASLEVLLLLLCWWGKKESEDITRNFSHYPIQTIIRIR